MATVNDPGQRPRLGDVDPDDPGPRMRRQCQRAVEQAGRVDVGGERPEAERQFAALVTLERLANPAVLGHRRQRRAAELDRLDQFDRVDDLHIAGATAEMPVDQPRDLGPRQPLALIGHPLDAQNQAGGAEPALQAGGDLKSVGVEFQLARRHAFERGDRPALDLLDPHRAGHFRLAVDQRQTCAALPLGGAARLERLELERLPQRFEQRLVRPGLGLARFAVQLEFDQFSCSARFERT